MGPGGFAVRSPVHFPERNPAAEPVPKAFRAGHRWGLPSTCQAPSHGSLGHLTPSEYASQRQDEPTAEAA
jgi:hypothetical protein